MVSLSTMLAGCLCSAVIGFLVSVISVRRISPGRSAAAANVVESDPQSAQSTREKEIERLVTSVYELTSQVDSQVGNHSLRVTEITESLNRPDTEQVGAGLVLMAGNMLVEANRKLQAELEEAKKEIQNQREQMNSCMQESRTDALTSLANRRALDLELGRVLAQRRRDGSPFSVLMIDIDYFKRINDQYGHMVGDQLLKCFSRCLTNTFRETDFVARFGGEEFVAILTRTSREDASRAAERVRLAIEASRLKVGELEIQLTASLGIKEALDNETKDEILQKADEALYAAKRGGRNRCYYYDSGASHQYFPPVVKPETSTSELSDEIPMEESTELVSVWQERDSRLPLKVVSRTNAEKRVRQPIESIE